MFLSVSSIYISIFNCTVLIIRIRGSIDWTVKFTVVFVTDFNICEPTAVFLSKSNSFSVWSCFFFLLNENHSTGKITRTQKWSHSEQSIYEFQFKSIHNNHLFFFFKLESYRAHLVIQNHYNYLIRFGDKINLLVKRNAKEHIKIMIYVYFCILCVCVCVFFLVCLNWIKLQTCSSKRMVYHCFPFLFRFVAIIIINERLQLK